MKTAMLVTDCGPVLVSTRCGSLAEPGFAQALRAKGIDKFIACEVSLDRCRRLYPHRFQEGRDDVGHELCVDVLDVDGRRIFLNFPFAELGAPLLVDRQAPEIQVTP
jgi:hypothetical protein